MPSSFVQAALLERNRLSGPFFARQAGALALACREMADRFARGGRLLALGRGPYATDAQHVEVEFVHPVLVGKRALPALDLSPSSGAGLEVLLRPEDVVMAFGPPGGDPDLAPLLSRAAARGALTFALPGTEGAYALPPWDADPFIHQELVEILYHTLWETVHVFLEHRGRGHDVGPAGFLYPFLERESHDAGELVEEVAASIAAKAAGTERLRERVAREGGGAIAATAAAVHDRLRRGGGLVLLGNGGSATDANDWALDCVASPKGHAPVRAVSLAAAPAVLSALANDLGAEELFRRQVIAHAGPHDVVVAISTSGGSRNVMAALREARARGALTVALLGRDGGEVLRCGAADHPIVVPSDEVPRVQEVQASIYHVMLDLLEALGRGAGPEPPRGA